MKSRPYLLFIMKNILPVFIAVFTLSCTGTEQVKQPETADSKTDTMPAKKTTQQFADYDELTLSGSQSLSAAEGTKSVTFNTNGSKLYAMNLEGMSVYEFDGSTKKITREFIFKPHKGTGWDYVREKPIPSFQEKPVEACFSNDDKILWVSLHNADGIVPLPVSDFTFDNNTQYKKLKKVYIKTPDSKKRDSINVPLIITGKTPKVIARTENSSHILVSNWHSYNVSVLSVDTTKYPYAFLQKNIASKAIPRGIVVDDKKGKSYVAIMGSSRIDAIDNNTWKKDSSIKVASNPRHVVMDDDGRLFVSYNKLAKVACIDPATGKTLFSAKTAAQPRTIILSKNKKFLFVTCYSGNTVEVFKIEGNKFIKKYSLPCKGKPVGVDIRETDDTVEAWVCNYVGGNIKVFSFKKS